MKRISLLVGLICFLSLSIYGAAIIEQFGVANDGTPLYWKAAIPTDGKKHPAIVMLAGGRFKNPKSVPSIAINDLVAAGYAVFAAEYRLAPPRQLAGQTSNGRYPDQTNDVHLAVRSARHHSRANGQVAIVGGSAGASHAIFVGATGTAGEDRADVVVALSPVTDMADPESAQHGSWYRDVTNYVGSTDLAALTNASPVHYFTATSAPTFVICSDHEVMPIGQYNSIVNLAGSWSNFQSLLRSNSTLHSFLYWGDVKVRVIAFLSDKLSASPTPAPTATVTFTPTPEPTAARLSD